MSETKRQQGFTLVELLVVIAIIAILAVIGLTVFTGLQRGARDTQRKADVVAITRALEANYNTTTAQYPQLTTSNFATGRIPQDPLSGQTQACKSNTCDYCIGTVNNGGANPVGPANPFTGATPITGCGAAGTGGTAPAQYNAIRNSSFPDITGATGFIVCANLETGGGNYASGNTFCQGNQR